MKEQLYEESAGINLHILVQLFCYIIHVLSNIVHFLSILIALILFYPSV